MAEVLTAAERGAFGTIWFEIRDLHIMGLIFL